MAEQDEPQESPAHPPSAGGQRHVGAQPQVGGQPLVGGLDEGGEHVHEAECEDAVSILWEYLDGELDNVTMVRVREHLERCSPCLEAFDFHAELRHVVQHRCTESMPSDVRGRLLDLIGDDNATTA